MNFEDLPTTDDFTDYDWKEVLGYEYPRSPAKWYDYSATPKLTATARHAADLTSNRRWPVKLDEFEQVLALYATTSGGVCHELDAVILIAVEDGDWMLCEAWTDCTGWGCQDGVEWWVGTPGQIRAIITPAQAKKLGEVGWS